MATINTPVGADCTYTINTSDSNQYTWSTIGTGIGTTSTDEYYITDGTSTTTIDPTRGYVTQVMPDDWGKFKGTQSGRVCNPALAERINSMRDK